MRLLAAFLLTLSLAPPVAAERFLGFGPGDRLGDAQKRFPNASIEEIRPVWLQPYQRLVQIAGTGIDGVLALKLEHEVDRLSLRLKDLAIKQLNRIELTQREIWAFENYPRMIERLRESPPLDPWEVEEVRWEPLRAISRQSLVSKYGTPEKDEQDEQFRRVLRWETRGISAYLNDADIVQVMIFGFSLGDILCASQWRQGKECDPLDSTGTKKKSPERDQRQNLKPTGSTTEKIRK